jgi:membrane protein
MAGFHALRPKSSLQRGFEAALWKRVEWGAKVLRRTRGGLFLIDCVVAAAAVVRGFLGEKISLRASALTYITMLSMVPLLTVAFAIVRSLGQESLRRMVHDFIYTNLAPAAREQTSAYLDNFIERAHAGAMGGLGALFLVVSAVSLLNNIEVSLNEIWGVKRRRFIGQRIVIYWCVLTLGPIALGTSLLATGAMRAAVEESKVVPTSVLALVPFCTTIFIFTFLYYFAPNARVRLRAALGGGVVAGSAWEIAKHAYALYAAKSIQYDAIYGSLGQIPVFLVWVYVSWLLLLFGARLAYALQYAAGAVTHHTLANPRAREVLCSQVAVGVAAHYLSGSEPLSTGRLAGLLHIEERLAEEAVGALLEGGLLAQAANGGVVPARPPGEIALLDVARVARGTLFSQDSKALQSGPDVRKLADLFAAADQAGRESLARHSLEALARMELPPDQERKAISN